jgi:hypothetical protein
LVGYGSGVESGKIRPSNPHSILGGKGGGSTFLCFPEFLILQKDRACAAPVKLSTVILTTVFKKCNASYNFGLGKRFLRKFLEINFPMF